jgi:Flp pilus assembly pilin Flp
VAPPTAAYQNERHPPIGRCTYLEAIMLLRSKGQGLAEYALILALIAILAITALLFLSGQINTILSSIGKSL